MPFGQLGVFEYHLCLSGNLSLPERTVRERFVNGPVRERGGHDQLKYERTVHERFTNGHVRERVVCTGKFRERTHERTNTNGSFKRSLNANMNGQHWRRRVSRPAAPELLKVSFRGGRDAKAIYLQR